MDDIRCSAGKSRGGAVILKVGGTKHDSRAERAKKIFLYPHFFKCGGTSKQMSLLNTSKFAVWLLPILCKSANETISRFSNDKSNQMAALC